MGEGSWGRLQSPRKLINSPGRPAGRRLLNGGEKLTSDYEDPKGQKRMEEGPKRAVVGDTRVSTLSRRLTEAFSWGEKEGLTYSEKGRKSKIGGLQTEHSMGENEKSKKGKRGKGEGVITGLKT